MQPTDMLKVLEISKFKLKQCTCIHSNCHDILAKLPSDNTFLSCIPCLVSSVTNILCCLKTKSVQFSYPDTVSLKNKLHIKWDVAQWIVSQSPWKEKLIFCAVLIESIKGLKVFITHISQHQSEHIKRDNSCIRSHWITLAGIAVR